MPKLKEPLFFALHRRWGNYRVVAVTTYKEQRGRWHGRYVHDNEGTHGAGDLEGRFATQEAAEAKVRGLEEIKERHAPLISTAERALRAAERNQRDELDAYLKEKQ